MLISIPRATAQAQGLSITSAVHSTPMHAPLNLIPLSPKLLLPHHQQPKRPLSFLPPFPRPSFSAPLLRPSLLLLHAGSIAHYTGPCAV
jgi:hypothetical protein